MYQNKNFLFFLAVLLGLLPVACTEEFVNPFDQAAEEVAPVDTTEAGLDPTSIAGLHANIFGKTCANSGCHDGTFEPDFRTIESTYSTLVFHPVIKNDPQGSFEYRVTPGDVEQSQLIARLTYDIDGNSGIMPLAVDPDSDWLEKRETYIDNIKTWISNGALDVLGNVPVIHSQLPQMHGVAAKAGDWLSRDDNGQGAILIPAGTEKVDLYIAVSDDETELSNLKENKIRFSASRIEFAGADSLQLQLLSQPAQRPGYYGESASYFHKVSIRPEDYGEAGQTVYFRVYFQDDDNPVTEIPSGGSPAYIKDYFSFTIVE